MELSSAQPFPILIHPALPCLSTVAAFLEYTNLTVEMVSYNYYCYYHPYGAVDSGSVSQWSFNVEFLCHSGYE